MCEHLHDRVQKYWRAYTVMGWRYQEIAALQKGLRRVILVERASTESLARLSRLWRRHGLRSRPLKAGEGKGVMAYAQERWGDEFERASRVRDVAARGRLLGYPECCIKFHLAQKGDVDPLRTYRRSHGRFHYLLNNIAGDVRLVSHFPCSYNCGESVKLARKVLAAVRKEHGDGVADDIVEVLKHKGVYYKGVYFSFKELDEPFSPVRLLLGVCGIREEDSILVGKEKTILIPNLGTPSEIMKGRVLFDFR